MNRRKYNLITYFYDRKSFKVFIQIWRMSFGIRIDGVENAINEIEKMKRSLGIDDLDFWCKRISNDIKLKAQNDAGEKLNLEISLDEKENPNIHLSFMPELTELIIEVITNYLIEMPQITRGIFEGIIKTVQQRKEEAKK
jgi:hypothetical protein